MFLWLHVLVAVQHMHSSSQVVTTSAWLTQTFAAGISGGDGLVEDVILAIFCFRVVG